MVLGWLTDPALTGQSMLLVLAAVLLAAIVVSLAYADRTAPLLSLAVVTVDGHEHRPAYVRLSDPAAPGRPRPRAPSCRSTAA